MDDVQLTEKEMEYYRNALPARLREVAMSRKQVAIHQEHAKQVLSKLEATDQLYQAYLAALDSHKYWRALADEAELIARNAALGVFDGSDKKPAPGVQIKEFDVVRITDRKAALIWAIENMPDAVKLDEKKLADGIKKLNVPFATVSVEYRPQLASDLSMYLEESDVK